jgi:competence protein ComEC
VALAAAALAGVLAGTRFPVAAGWVAATLTLAAACLWPGRRSRPRPRATAGPWVAAAGPGVGVLVLATLVAGGGAAAAVRAAALREGALAGLVGRPGRVEVTGTVAEEPRRVRYGGDWVVLTVERVRVGDRVQRTRERAGVVLGRIPAAEGQAGVGDALVGTGQTLGLGVRGGGGRLGVGDRVRVRGAVVKARWGDALGRRPAVVLRHPVVEERAPPRGPGGVVLRGSEAVREAARRRALAALPPERAGLLVGMALGDTSLLPGDLERDFRAAGLTHLMAVSGTIAG